MVTKKKKTTPAVDISIRIGDENANGKADISASATFYGVKRIDVGPFDVDGGPLLVSYVQAAFGMMKGGPLAKAVKSVGDAFIGNNAPNLLRVAADLISGRASGVNVMFRGPPASDDGRGN
jgi:hypothetical protein